MDLLNQKELPRVIYNFDQNILLEKNDYYNDLSNIIKFNNNEKEDENYIEEHYDKEKINKNEIHNENNMDIDKNDNNQKEIIHILFLLKDLMESFIGINL